LIGSDHFRSKKEGLNAKVVHFEIPADDPEMATKFYKGVFGWKIDEFEGEFDYWLVNTEEEDEPGINGAINPKEFWFWVSDVINVGLLRGI